MLGFYSPKKETTNAKDGDRIEKAEESMDNEPMRVSSKEKKAASKRESSKTETKKAEAVKSSVHG